MNVKRIHYILFICCSLLLPLLYTVWVYSDLSDVSKLTRHGGVYLDVETSSELLANGKQWSLIFYSPDPWSAQTKQQLEQLYRRWLMLGSKRYRTQLVWWVDEASFLEQKPDWFTKQSTFKLLDIDLHSLPRQNPVVLIASPRGRIGIEHEFQGDVSPVFSDLLYLLKAG